MVIPAPAEPVTCAAAIWRRGWIAGWQRTWTVMIYLNNVSRGGQTCFNKLERCFTPVRGLALAWNNLMADGTPNPFTLHEAMPVQEGTKWVITKWFRAQSGRNG